MEWDCVIVGGGASGVFAAIRFAEIRRDSRTLVLEAGSRFLSKVRISGGGRCNVTHACFDPKELVKAYPRGSKELLGPFSRFQPQDTVDWFNSRGVCLKTEPDGRIFPSSDSSETIISALFDAARNAGVQLQSNAKVRSILPCGVGFSLSLERHPETIARTIILATGGGRQGHALAASLGHTITPVAPSLFSFKAKHSLLDGFAGTSFLNCHLSLSIDGKKSFSQIGPLLITHWGVSGPAVLKLSAYAARDLAAASYRATLDINWLGDISRDDLLTLLKRVRANSPTKIVRNQPVARLTKRFWESLLTFSDIPHDLCFSDLSNNQLTRIAETVTSSTLSINGKGEFKEEFVTCGGVKLSEVDLRRMESKILPGLFCTGELLDVDGVTGGFNFQHAWTSGWIAGTAAAQAI